VSRIIACKYTVQTMFVAGWNGSRLLRCCLCTHLEIAILCCGDMRRFSRGSCDSESYSESESESDGESDSESKSQSQSESESESESGSESERPRVILLMSCSNCHRIRFD